MLYLTSHYYIIQGISPESILYNIFTFFLQTILFSVNENSKQENQHKTTYCYSSLSALARNNLLSYQRINGLISQTNSTYLHIYIY